MLVLSRGPKDKVLFPNLGISVEILRVSGNRVRLGIDAPDDVRILRHELADSLSAELQSAEPQQEPAKLDREMRHKLNNQLNAAHVALSLAQKQLDVGLSDDALETLHRAIRAFDTIDSQAAPKVPHSEADDVHDPARRALLVEDDANECELLAGYLRMSGFEVDTAGDGLQAMVYLSRHKRPDVVLMDMHMPRFDGPRAVRTIRSNPDFRGMRLFAVTGSTPEESKLSVGPRGVDRWFSKPINPQQLVDEINREIDASHGLSV